MHTLEAQLDSLTAELQRLRTTHTTLVRRGQLLQQRLCVEDERLVDVQRACFPDAAWFDAGSDLPQVSIGDDGTVRMGTMRMSIRADADKVQRFATNASEVRYVGRAS